MDTRQSVFIATSLDGFIAKPDGDIEWLHADFGPSDGGDYGYKTFIDSVDAIVMGRNSYEKVLSFGGKWPYEVKKVIVLSSGRLDIPGKISSTVSAMSGGPHQIVRQLANEGYAHLYIDGGLTIQKFLEAGLIQKLIITRIPVLLGEGIPLFGPLSGEKKLRHISTSSYTNGFVQSTYEVLHH